jgi:hypothetical protein
MDPVDYPYANLAGARITHAVALFDDDTEELVTVCGQVRDNLTGAREPHYPLCGECCR